MYMDIPECSHIFSNMFQYNVVGLGLSGSKMIQNVSQGQRISIKVPLSIFLSFFVMGNSRNGCLGNAKCTNSDYSSSEKFVSYEQTLKFSTSCKEAGEPDIAVHGCNPGGTSRYLNR